MVPDQNNELQNAKNLEFYKQSVYVANNQGDVQLGVLETISFYKTKKGPWSIGSRTTITIQVTKKIGSKKKRQVFNMVRVGKRHKLIHEFHRLNRPNIKILNISYKKCYHYPLIWVKS